MNVSNSQLVAERKAKVKQFFGTITKEQWIVALNVTILFAMGILHSLEAGHYVNFIPINGTFQDYNPVRRFLDGQIPYKDFNDYLGLGHLYMGSIFTWIMGATYRSSLIAFRFAAFMSTALIFHTVCRIVLKKNTTVLTITNLMLVILLIQPTFLDIIVGDSEVKSALDYAMTTGNSARMLRGAILPISTVLILQFGNKAIEFIKNKKFRISRIYIASIMIGLLAGYCLQWSNDYGISSWLCLLLFFFWAVLSRIRKLLKTLISMLIALITSFAGCFIVVELVTCGNFSNWFLSTFGTGGYQSWYYIGPKSYYITDVDFSCIMLIQLGLSLIYLIKVWKSHADNDSLFRYGLLAYMNITSFCAVNEYKLLSGGASREVALVILFATVIAEICNLMGKMFVKNQLRYTLYISTPVLCTAWIGSVFLMEFNFNVFTEKEGIYVEAMGGYLTSLGDDLLKTAEFLGGAKTFATYASAQELVSGHYQPSGTDYIIHVLGDKQREDYLESFENDDFDYAVTINEIYSVWEYWLQRANWFFYESLFENWHPVYANSYEIYWERNTFDGNSSTYFDDIDVHVENVNDSRALRVVVETDENISGTADVYIDYNTNKDECRSSYFIFNSMVREVNSGEYLCDNINYERTNIRNSGRENIPVTIVDGYGEVTLTSEPQKSTYLTINEVQCSKIYTVQYEYVCIDEIENDGNEYLLHVVGSQRTNKILDAAKYIYINGNAIEIERIADGYIYLSTDEDFSISSEILKTKNMFKVE